MDRLTQLLRGHRAVSAAGAVSSPGALGSSQCPGRLNQKFFRGLGCTVGAAALALRMRFVEAPNANKSRETQL